MEKREMTVYRARDQHGDKQAIDCKGNGCVMWDFPQATG